MCSYYDRHREPRRLEIDLQVRQHDLPNMQPNYLVKISHIEPVVAIGKDGQRRFVPMRWGLIAPWSPEFKSKYATHNAMAESIATSRLYAKPFAKGRRCLAPVDGFFEFTGETGNKQPHYFRPRDGRTMAFAGLWESWSPKGSSGLAGTAASGTDIGEPTAAPQLSYTIATCEPNAVTRPIHTRMPVLFTEAAQFDRWLDPATSADELQAMLVPAPDDLLETYPVMRGIVKLKSPGPEIIAPLP